MKKRSFSVGRRRGRRAVDLPQDKELVLLLPEYTKQGDATRLCLTDGSEQVVQVSVEAVLAGLARRHCKDLRLLRRRMEELTHERANNPLPLSAALVLASFRWRDPQRQGDSALGYVNAALDVRAVPLESEPRCGRDGRSKGVLKAQRLKRAGRRQAVLVVGSRRVPTLWTMETVNKHLNGAKILYESLLREAAEAVAAAGRECALRQASFG